MHTVDPDAYRMGEPRPLNQSPCGQTGETSPSCDKLCLGGGPHADGACHCCSCVHRVRIDRGRTRLVRVPAADGQRTSSVTSGGQLAIIVRKLKQVAAINYVWEEAPMRMVLSTVSTERADLVRSIPMARQWRPFRSAAQDRHERWGFRRARSR